MSQPPDARRFSFAPLVMLFLPHVAISYFCANSDPWPAALATAAGITGLGLLLYVARHWAELMAGMLGSLLLIAILAGCALIPFVGWIADILIVLYALASVLSSIVALIPYALKAALVWAVFLVSLAPAVFHPVVSPAIVFVVALGLGAALGKKESPLDEFLVTLSSIPLLVMAIASLGRMFSSGIAMKTGRVQQNVSGYTTRAGVQVADYTRTVTRQVAIPTSTLNPGAAVIGSAAGQTARQESDA